MCILRAHPGSPSCRGRKPWGLDCTLTPGLTELTLPLGSLWGGMSCPGQVLITQIETEEKAAVSLCSFVGGAQSSPKCMARGLSNNHPVTFLCAGGEVGTTGQDTGFMDHMASDALGSLDLPWQPVPFHTST